MEMTGMLDDDLREEAENLFYRWVESREGLARIDEPVYLLPGYPRQNHGLLPAMGIRWLADFFLRYHPELERPRSWKEIADRVFSVYQDGSWKPICDGLCHGWSMSQPVMAEYGLYDEKHGYFASGGARKAAECAIAVVNNEGWMPSSGDSTLKRGFQGTFLAAAAEYYQDGRYLFVRNMAPFWRQGNLDWTSYLSRSFDIGLEPVLPEDHIGVRVIPMDPLVYHAWDAFPDRSELVVASTRPPEVPLEKCFDRLTYRSGFDTQDEYLLIDGLGGGSHSYDDAMSIVDYEKFGVDFVVAEDDLVNNETENHSMVTIIRNGECEKVPSSRLWKKSGGTGQGSVYLSMILKNCIRNRLEAGDLPNSGSRPGDSGHRDCSGKSALPDHLPITDTGKSHSEGKQPAEPPDEWEWGNGMVPNGTSRFCALPLQRRGKTARQRPAQI